MAEVVSHLAEWLVLAKALHRAAIREDRKNFDQGWPRWSHIWLSGRFPRDVASRRDRGRSQAVVENRPRMAGFAFARLDPRMNKASGLRHRGGVRRRPGTGCDHEQAVARGLPQYCSVTKRDRNLTRNRYCDNNLSCTFRIGISCVRMRTKRGAADGG